MPVSEFIPKNGYHQHSVNRTAAANFGADLDPVIMGDGTFLQVRDDASSTLHIWDLALPDVGREIPKTAEIRGVKIEFVPDATTSGVFPENRAHEIGLMASDGHWDRPSSHALHQPVSGVNYSAPSLLYCLRAAGVKVGGGLAGFTMSDLTGSFGLGTGFVNAYLGWGTTMQLFADTERVSFWGGRPDNPGADMDMVLNCYRLSENGRHYAYDELIGSSDPVSYLSLTHDPTLAAFDAINFEFSTPLVPSGGLEWLGFQIEGAVFAEANRLTHQYYIEARLGSSQTSYLSGTHGGLVHAGTELDLGNALARQYFHHRDAPSMYTDNSTTRMTTPYPRHFGAPVSCDDCGEWTAGVSKSYGEGAGLTFDVEFTGLAAHVQQWFESSAYDPGSDKTWIGMMIEVPIADFAEWEMKGFLSSPIRLVIDWHPRGAPRARTRHRSRVEAAGSAQQQRVSGGEQYRERVAAPLGLGSDRVGATAKYMERVGAFNTRFWRRVAAGDRHHARVRATPHLHERVIAKENRMERVAATSAAKPRVRILFDMSANRVRAPLSRARSGV